MSNITELPSSSILDGLKKIYTFSSTGIDPEVDGWFLMGSPIQMLCIIFGYLIFVTRLGPWLMRDRPAYKLKEVLLIYNAVQILLCGFIVSRINLVEDAFSWLFSFGCRFDVVRDRALGETVIRGAYWYTIAKLLDLLDTVFFVLRKKSNQITFLHIYHHTLTFTTSWLYVKYIPGEAGVFIGLINSLVHVLMYIYYLLSALGPEFRKYLWWKKYITWIQLIQFVAVAMYMTTFILFGCQYDKSTLTFYIINAFFFMYLFANFYRNSYLPKAVDSKTCTEPKKIE